MFIITELLIMSTQQLRLPPQLLIFVISPLGTASVWVCNLPGLLHTSSCHLRVAKIKPNKTSMQHISSSQPPHWIVSRAPIAD